MKCPLRLLKLSKNNRLNSSPSKNKQKKQTLDY